MITKLVEGNKIVGVKQVKRALLSQTVETVYIAEDAEKKITDVIKDICTEKHIKVFYVDNMKELGHACGIDVNAAVAALIK